MDYSRAAGIIGIVCLSVLASPAAGSASARIWPSNGLVSMWSGQSNAADSVGKNHGRASGGVKYAPGISGLAFKLDGKSAYIHVDNSAALQITGDQTIAMWLKPERLGVRRNPIAKAYGGELTITLEPTGELSYYYGTSGLLAEPYEGFSVPNVIKAGKWTHIAVVRDFKARKLRWYINGALKLERDSKFNKARASKRPLYLGKGYVNNYCGLIDEVCLWRRALSAGEIAAVASSVPLGAPVVPRNAKLDNVRPHDGSVLLGKIQNQDWSITTAYGKFNIPAARVVGFASKVTAPAASRPVAADVRMLLIDGQVLAGRLLASHLQLELPDAQILKIPLHQIKQCGYRIGPKKSANVSEVRKAYEKFPATAVLRSGDHLAWNSSGVKIRFESVYGPLDLRPEIVSSIAPARDNMWRVNLNDSSLILGTLGSKALKLKLALGNEITVPGRDIMYLTMPAAIAKPTDSTTVVLSHGDRLLGRLIDKVLKVRTAYGTVLIPMADVWTIESLGNGTAKLTMQNSTVLRCQLTDHSLDMVLASGFKFAVRVDRIVSVTAPRKLPTEVVRKIEALIKELGDPSAAKRKTASQKLIAMGKDTIIVLKRHSNSKNAAISKGIKEVIDVLEGRVKPTPVPVDWLIEKRGGAVINL